MGGEKTKVLKEQMASQAQREAQKEEGGRQRTRNANRKDKREVWGVTGEKV